MPIPPRKDRPIPIGPLRGLSGHEAERQRKVRQAQIEVMWNEAMDG